MASRPAPVEGGFKRLAEIEQARKAQEASSGNAASQTVSYNEPVQGVQSTLKSPLKQIQSVGRLDERSDGLLGSAKSEDSQTAEVTIKNQLSEEPQRQQLARSKNRNRRSLLS